MHASGRELSNKDDVDSKPIRSANSLSPVFIRDDRCWHIVYRTELCLQVNRPLLRALKQNDTTCLCVCFIPHRLQFSEAIFLHLARFAFVGRDDVRYLLQKQKIFGGKICTFFCHCEIALDVQVLTIDRFYQDVLFFQFHKVIPHWFLSFFLKCFGDRSFLTWFWRFVKSLHPSIISFDDTCLSDVR